jgi:hypothetical protein
MHDLPSWCDEQRIWAPKLELFEKGGYRGLRTTAAVQEGEVRYPIPNGWLEHRMRVRRAAPCAASYRCSVQGF